jgi:uncharacterized membrane protein YhhN
MKKVFLIGFIIAAFGEILSQVVPMDYVHMVCKPLLMVFLTGYYLSSVARENISRALTIALVLSFAGDVLLMKENLFVPGLIAFLLAHVFYIFAYRQHQSDETENALLGVQRIRLAFPVVLAGTGLVIILFPVLGDLRIPVIIYALVLVLMALNALFRFGRTSSASFWLVFIGAVLFMVSDSFLAINKFLMPVEHGGVLIMATYVTAQFLIVKGLLTHK